MSPPAATTGDVVVRELRSPGTTCAAAEPARLTATTATSTAQPIAEGRARALMARRCRLRLRVRLPIDADGAIEAMRGGDRSQTAAGDRIEQAAGRAGIGQRR